MTSRLRLVTRHPTWIITSIVLKIGFISHYLLSHVGAVSLTDGPSMVPTMSVRGDRFYISKSYRRGKGLKVGDVVSFKHPMAVGEGAIKRVMGMSGDFVMTEEKEKGERKMIQVPEGHCWVLGDNLPESRDSRIYGPIPLALVKGKVVARVWPLEDLGWVRNTLQRPKGDV